jgi:hypothetical protein
MQAIRAAEDRDARKHGDHVSDLLARLAVAKDKIHDLERLVTTAKNAWDRNGVPS